MTITTKFNRGDIVRDASRNKCFTINKIRIQVFPDPEDNSTLILHEYKSESGPWVPSRDLEPIHLTPIVL